MFMIPFMTKLYPWLRSLTHEDDQGSLFSQKVASTYFWHSTDLPKVSLMKSPFKNGQSSDLEEQENMLSLQQGRLRIV